MYRWNINYIKSLIKQLDSITHVPYELVTEDIEALKELIIILKNKDNFLKKELIRNLYYENEDYKEFKHFNSLVNPIINKYCDEPDYNIRFKNIDYSKEDLLIHTRDNIKNISTKWAKVLEPYFFNKDIIDFRKGNNNFMLYINSLKKVFVSLSKDNNINDFIIPTHEFLHIYATLLNEKTITRIENEFLSLLGEFITSYEMKKNNMFKDEIVKFEMDSFCNNSVYTDCVILKKDAIKNNIYYKKKLDYLHKKYKISIKYLKSIYATLISYDYSAILSYFIALELFEIYKIDKEKCVYICENIIKSDDKIFKKLRDNKIELLTHDEEYVKKLKKEYATLSNQ